VSFQADYRPASGSCARCRAALGLASLRAGDVWYCSSACARGEAPDGVRPPAVDEAALTNRPRRFFRRRAPKELHRAENEPAPVP
jgi:hypothetical protein